VLVQGEVQVIDYMLNYQEVVTSSARTTLSVGALPMAELSGVEYRVSRCEARVSALCPNQLHIKANCTYSGAAPTHWVTRPRLKHEKMAIQLIEVTADDSVDD
jgi:hypothetical protein